MEDSFLSQPATSSAIQSIGFVMANYIDAKLSERIYMTNFVSQHTHTYNEKGFCTICGQYQPAVYNKSTDVYTINNAGQLFWFSSLVNGDHSYADLISKMQVQTQNLPQTLTLKIGNGRLSIIIKAILTAKDTVF